MEYGKRDGYVTLSKLKDRELLGFLKTQIQGTIFFQKEKDVFTIDLLKRTLVGNEQMVEIVSATNGKNAHREIITYLELIKNLSTLMQHGVMHIELERRVFKEKEPIIILWDSITPAILQNCVYVDFVDGVYHLINKNVKKLPEKLYYFEDNDEVLVFSQNGPIIIPGTKYNSVQDVFCR